MTRMKFLVLASAMVATFVMPAPAHGDAKRDLMRSMIHGSWVGQERSRTPFGSGPVRDRRIIRAAWRARPSRLSCGPFHVLSPGRIRCATTLHSPLEAHRSWPSRSRWTRNVGKPRGLSFVGSEPADFPGSGDFRRGQPLSRNSRLPGRFGTLISGWVTGRIWGLPERISGPFSTSPGNPRNRDGRP
jgi:hypothetical protein